MKTLTALTATSDGRAFGTFDAGHPALQALDAAPHLSARYGKVSTAAVIDLMAAEGYEVAEVRGARRSKAPAWAKHSVDFRRVDAKEIAPGTVPRIVFLNSHNGSSGAAFVAGAYRFVCANGLLIGNTYASVSVRHTTDAAAALIDRIRELSKTTLPMFAQIGRWCALETTAAQRAALATQAAELRFGAGHGYDTADLLVPRRLEDDTGDFWTVFNRIQENAMIGGLMGVSATGRATMSQRITGVAADAEFNVAFWRAAEVIAA